MASTYENSLRLELIATGEAASTWGDKTNTNLTAIAAAFGYATQDGFAADANATTTVADGAADPARALYFKITSSATLTATRTLTIAPNTISRVMWIENATTGSQSIAISQGSGANVTIPAGKTAVVYLDGAGAGASVVDAMASLNIDGSISAGAATFSGTVTADGLIVGDGHTIGNDGFDNLVIASSTAENIVLNANDAGVTVKGDTQFLIETEFGTDRFKVDTSTGDISFYNTAGTTAKLVWDASAESLGIGTSAPATTLHITKDGNQSAVLDAYEAQQVSHNTIAYTRWVQNASGIANIMGVDSSAGILGTSSNHALAIRTNSTERARLTSDGNLLVGKTAASFSVNGVALSATGLDPAGWNSFITATPTASGGVQALNRKSSDGVIQGFYKDGTTVGSIGVLNGNNLSISGSVSNHTGIQFGTAVITPMKSGAENDGDVDLGFSNARFKDLHLSGGVVFGTTGGSVSSKTLDDYETGNWTPVLTGTGYSFGTHTGRYVKVGNLVYITAVFNVTTVGANNSIIAWSGAPFTSLSFTNLHQMGVVRESSTTGRLYQIQINAGASGGSLNSMDGISGGSNAIFTAGNYAVSVTYSA